MNVLLGQVVRERARSTPQFGIVVGTSKAGKVRIRRWQDAQAHWSAPIAIAEAQLEPVDDPFALPLTEAKRLMAVMFEREYLIRMMERTGGSLSEAGRMANIDRSNFRRLLERHGLRTKQAE